MTVQNLKYQTEIEKKIDTEFLLDVIQGLSSPQKTLPCKYFYDEAGSDLFEKICGSDEYYVTDIEIELLKNNIKSIADALPDDCNIIEPGSGAGIKIQLLLTALNKPKSFTPMDISPSALKYSVNMIKDKFPQLEVNGMVGDFTDQNNIIKINKLNLNNNVVFFPGSTIGNFEENDAVSIIENLSILAGKNGKVLIGVDLIKPLHLLLSAYNDKEGITEAFNKNLLHRINKELVGEFDVDKNFKHESVFNQEKSRIEMHLIARHAHKVNVNGIDFHFREGESIHTENSHKYTIEKFKQMTEKAGLKIEKSWCAPKDSFGLFLLSQ